MPVQTRTQNLSTPDGAMDLYVAKPEGAGPWPGLVIVQEAFGVNDHIQDVTRRFAEQGYCAVAPDLFHRSDVRTVPYSEMKTAIGMISQLKNDMVMNDIDAAIGWLQQQSDVKRDHIGVLGYCFGGRCAYLAATRSKEIAAAVCYYGGGIVAEGNPNAPVSKSAAIEAPVLLFFGAKDQMVTPDQAHTIDRTLTELGKEHQVKIYDNAGHGFFCDARGSYVEQAARDAWQITLDFLGKHLR